MSKHLETMDWEAWWPSKKSEVNLRIVRWRVATLMNGNEFGPNPSGAPESIFVQTADEEVARRIVSLVADMHPGAKYGTVHKGTPRMSCLLPSHCKCLVLTKEAVEKILEMTK